MKINVSVCLLNSVESVRCNQFVLALMKTFSLRMDLSLLLLLEITASIKRQDL